jgi:hypothetical protein
LQVPERLGQIGKSVGDRQGDGSPRHLGRCRSLRPRIHPCRYINPVDRVGCSRLPMNPDPDLTLDQLGPLLDRFWKPPARKIRLIDERVRCRQGLAGVHGRRRLHDPRLDRVDAGLPVWRDLPAVRRHRRRTGSSTTRSDETIDKMAPHVSHIGVHDHGFNNVSTYGNWLRLIREGKAEDTGGWAEMCRVALKVSGAVQARRWSQIEGGGGLHLLVQRPAQRCSSTPSGAAGR